MLGAELVEPVLARVHAQCGGTDEVGDEEGHDAGRHRSTHIAVGLMEAHPSHGMPGHLFAADVRRVYGGLHPGDRGRFSDS